MGDRENKIWRRGAQARGGGGGEEEEFQGVSSLGCSFNSPGPNVTDFEVQLFQKVKDNGVYQGSSQGGGGEGGQNIFGVVRTTTNAL